MTRAGAFAMTLAAVVSASCAGSPARLTIRPIHADVDSEDVSVLNTGDAATAPLTVTLSSSGVFSIDSEDCSGRAVAPQETCFVRIHFPASSAAQPEGTLTVDDGHGAHATTTLDATVAIPHLAAQTNDSVVSLGEGQTGDALVRVTNSGIGDTGPIALDFPANIVSDSCSGVALRPNETCMFTIEYTAPVGKNPSMTVSGTVHADPGGSVPITIQFNVFGQLTTSGLAILSPAPAGASATVTVSANLYVGALTVGPLQLSIVNGAGAAYAPFVLAAGQDHCSGQTLTAAMSSCEVVIALDPRLLPGLTYSATLLVQAGGEMTTLPMMVTRGTP
jgi:hypothetical protein